MGRMIRVQDLVGGVPCAPMAPARRLGICMLAFASFGIAAAPSFADAALTHPRVADVRRDAVDGSAAGDDGATTTTIVASEGPVPEAGARSPSIGPILVPTSGSSVTGAWWLMAFGGLQLVGLFLITRRARARLSTDDAQP